MSSDTVALVRILREQSDSSLNRDCAFYGHQEVLVNIQELSCFEVVSCLRGAGHCPPFVRSWEKEDYIFNPLHYLVLIEQKTNALDQAYSAG